MTTPMTSPDALPSKLQSIEGSFNGHSMNIELFPVAGSKKLFINLHGTFWARRGSTGKYGNLANEIQEAWLANVMLYDTSRDWSKVAEYPANYEEKQAPFVGKTFDQELEDARRAIQYALDNSKHMLWVSSDELEITLHGNSLGGSLSFFLASEFPQVKNIITVGTWLRSQKWDVPVLDTFPDKEIVIEKLGKFQWNYYMAYGTKDEVYSQEAFDEFYKNIKNASSKWFGKFIGVDHNFSKKDGMKNDEAFSQIIANAKKFLQQGDIPTTEVNLSDNTDTSKVLIERIHERLEGIVWNGVIYQEADPFEHPGL